MQYLVSFRRSHPLAPVAAAFMTGIALQRWLAWPIEIVAWVLIALLLLCLFRSLRYAAVLLSVLAGGAFLYAWRFEIRSETDLRLILEEKEVLATVRGELLDTPAVQISVWGEKEFVRSAARVRVHGVRFKESWQPASGVIATSTRAELGARFFPGQLVEVTGILRPPPRAQAPGLFDYRTYLRHQRIFYTLQSENHQDWTILPESPISPPWTDRFRRWAKTQLGKGIPHDEATELIWSMALGWKTALNGEMAEPFMRTGTMHVFAISGLHIACIAGLLGGICRYGFAMPRHTCALIVLPLVWFYTVATGWQSSGVRAAIMSSILFLGWALRRPANLLNSTAAAGLLILLLCGPEHLFQAGFQLSLFVVASLALLMPRLEEWRQGLTASDPLLPRDLRPVWRRWADAPLHYFTVAFAVSLASWLGSLPIVAWYFNLVTPISPAANLLAVPLSSVSLAATVLSLALAPIGLAPVSNFLAWVFMWATVQTTQMFDLPAPGSFYVPKPSWAFFPFFYALLLCMFSKKLWQPQWRPWAVGAILLAGSLWITVGMLTQSRAQITMLNAAGNPVWIDLPGKSEDLLVDCSNERDWEYLVSRFLRAQGVNTFRNLLLTHGDINHGEGFFRAVAEFFPRKVYASTAPARSPTYRKIQTALRQNGLEHSFTRGSYVCGWRVLHPARSGYFPRADDNSAVLYREFHGTKILLLGDLGERGQRRLLESEPRLEADIVFSSMPEHGEPLLNELLEQLSPRLIVLGTTRFPWTSRGSTELRSRLALSGAELLSTADEGAVTIRFVEDRCEISTSFGKSFLLGSRKDE